MSAPLETAVALWSYDACLLLTSDAYYPMLRAPENAIGDCLGALVLMVVEVLEKLWSPEMNCRPQSTT